MKHLSLILGLAIGFVCSFASYPIAARFADSCAGLRFHLIRLLVFLVLGSCIFGPLWLLTH